jgi:NO-binding membrane sensor protein with MHYT domain
MSTVKSTAPLTSGFQHKFAAVLTALGAVVAVGVTVLALALTGANRTPIATAVTGSQVTADAMPQVHYMGPHQLQIAATAARRHRGRR